MRRHAATVALAALVCVAGGYGFWRSFGRRVDFLGAAGELAEAERAYRTAGLPWTASEIRSPVPPEQDAGPTLRRAFAAFDLPAWRRGWKEAGRDDAKRSALAARFAPALDLAVAAARRPGYDARRDEDLGPYATAADLAEIKGMGQGLAARGRPEDLRAVFRLGRLGAEGGGLIGLLVQVSTQRMALYAVRREAARDPGLRPALAHLLDEEFRPADLALAVRQDAYLGLTTARNFDLFGGVRGLGKLGETPQPPPRIETARLRRDGVPEGTVARTYLARILQTSVQRYDAARDPDPLRRVERLRVLAPDRERRRGFSYIVAEVVDTDWTLAASAPLMAEGDLRMTRWLLGSPAAPLPPDPFGGTIRADREGRWTRLRSSGPDGRDDGGKGDDVVVRG